MPFTLPVNTRQQTARPGFTLIELLVVIAIIAILASILFPVFARARENARRSSCASNLKQVGLGILQYVQDFDERMPYDQSPVQTCPNGLCTNTSWRGLLQPYIKSFQVFDCPSNSGLKRSDGYIYGISEDYSANISYWGYTYPGCGNACGAFGFSNYGTSFTLWTPPNLAQFTNSSQTITVLETVQVNDNAMGWAANEDPLRPYLFNGHLATANYLFMDGHVKALKPLATISAANGGAGSVNMWSRTGDDFSSNGGSPDIANAKANLAAAADKYK